MKSQLLQSTLIDYAARNSRHEPHRRYIGLSGIADCDLVIYDRFFAGERASVGEKLKHFLAYEIQDILTRVLAEAFVYLPPQAIAVHGGLVQGHTDGAVLFEGQTDLIEIKTLESDKYLPVPGQRVPNRHFYQVQAYLHFLELEHAHLIYFARDSADLRVIGLTYNRTVGKGIQTKIDRLAAAVSESRRPACTCGRCLKPKT